MGGRGVGVGLSQRELLQHEFPLLFWDSAQLEGISGLFVVGGREFFIRVNCPNGPHDLLGGALYVSSEFREAIEVTFTVFPSDDHKKGVLSACCRLKGR